MFYGYDRCRSSGSIIYNEKENDEVFVKELVMNNFVFI